MGESYIQSRSDRIRCAMFPDEARKADGNGPRIPIGSCIVDKLAEPSQLLTTAIVELLSLQDESELTTKAIPELVKLLSDKDEVSALNIMQAFECFHIFLVFHHISVVFISVVTFLLYSRVACFLNVYTAQSFGTI